MVSIAGSPLALKSANSLETFLENPAPSCRDRSQMKTVALLQAYLAQGVKRVVVSAPLKQPGALNIVLGINQHLIVTAALISLGLPKPSPANWE
jgi:hypothetical protein